MVGIATRYGLDEFEVPASVGLNHFSSPRRPDRPRPMVHPTFYPMGTGGSFHGGNATWT
jgi:hypothetical protein